MLGGYRDTTPIMENQMEKKMENEMETGIIYNPLAYGMGHLLWDPSLPLDFGLRAS